MRAALRLVWMLLLTLALLPLPLLTALFTVGAARPTARMGVWSMHLWCRGICRILNVRIEVVGRAPEGPFVFTPNHLGYFDILLLGAVYPSQFVAMAEVRSWPLFGFLSRLVGTLFIDRNQRRDVERVTKQMAATLSLRVPVTVFLEGKASPGDAVHPFRSSLLEVAVRDGIQCVPVTTWVDAPHPTEPPSNTVAWWGDATFAPHFQRLLGLKRIDARVTFGEPVPPGGDRKALALALEERVRERFVPIR